MTGLAAVIAAAVSWAVLGVLLRRAGLLPLDVPNARSLQVRAIPRGGGLAVWAGWFAGTLWLPGAKPWLGPLAAIIAVSLLDDIRGVHPAFRLTIHFTAAAAWIWLAVPALNPVVAVLAIVWMANLYNFMDGSDGLAGAMTVVGFGAYAIAAWLAGSVATYIEERRITRRVVRRATPATLPGVAGRPTIACASDTNEPNGIGMRSSAASMARPMSPAQRSLLWGLRIFILPPPATCRR